MNFRDHVKALEYYEYSREYYNLIKEASELDLMVQYLDNIEFTNDHHEELSKYTFTEGYLFESNKKDSINEKIDKKSESLLNKISKGFHKVFTLIFNFFKRVKDKLFKKNQDLTKDLSNMVPAVSKKELLQQAIRDAWKPEWNDLISLNKNPHSTSFDVNDVVSQIKSGKINIYLHNNFGSINNKTVISIEDYNKLVAKSCNILRQGFFKSMITKAKTGHTIKDAIKKDKITIDCNRESIDKIISEVEENQDKLNEVMWKLTGKKETRALHESTDELYIEADGMFVAATGMLGAAGTMATWHAYIYPKLCDKFGITAAKQLLTDIMHSGKNLNSPEAKKALIQILNSPDVKNAKNIVGNTYALYDTNFVKNFQNFEDKTKLIAAYDKMKQLYDHGFIPKKRLDEFTSKSSSFVKSIVGDIKTRSEQYIAGKMSTETRQLFTQLDNGTISGADLNKTQIEKIIKDGFKGRLEKYIPKSNIEKIETEIQHNLTVDTNNVTLEPKQPVSPKTASSVTGVSPTTRVMDPKDILDNKSLNKNNEPGLWDKFTTSIKDPQVQQWGLIISSVCIVLGIIWYGSAKYSSYKSSIKDFMTSINYISKNIITVYDRILQFRFNAIRNIKNIELSQG